MGRKGKRGRKGKGQEDTDADKEGRKGNENGETEGRWETEERR